MPITIECSACHRSYRLDDKLAGQRVRCRDCGAAIDIPGVAPVLPADSGAADAAGPGVPDLRSLFGAGGQPRTAVQTDVNFLEPTALPRRKRRWVRTSGSPMLESIDPLIKAASALILLAAIAVWVIHIYQTPAGISFSTLLPMIVVLAVIAGVLAPLMTLAINAAVRMIKLAPRDDAYSRIAAALLLPFSGAMIAGWPGMGASLGAVSTATWFLCPILLIYFFRAELFEWTVSIGAGIVALGLGLIGAGLVGSVVAAINGPLYRDMLPPGPWTGLASAHSPLPPPPPPPAPPPATLASAPATEQGSFGKPQENAAGSGAGGSATQIANAAGTNSDAGGPSSPGAGTQNGRPTRTPASRDIHSPFLIDVIPEEAGLTEISRVIAPVPPNGGMVVVKNTGNQSTVEKWDANPPADKADLTFPFFPKKPNGYALSPKNDDLVALCFFPRSEIDIFSFDGKTPRRTIPLDVPDAAPSLLGFSDASHFLMRWDQQSTASQGSSMAKIQSWNLAGQPLRMTATIPTTPGEASMAIAPGGKILAVNEPGAQLALYNLDSGALLRKIRLTDLSFSLVDMAFSPDASQVAVLGLVSDVPTILSFKTQTGAPLATAILAASWTRPPDDPMKHRLLWLQTGAGDDLWLVNGCDFLDPASGKKIGSLTVSSVLDVQPIGAGSLIFELPASADDTENAVVARLDEKALHEALGKVR